MGIGDIVGIVESLNHETLRLVNDPISSEIPFWERVRHLNSWNCDIMQE